MSVLVLASFSFTSVQRPSFPWQRDLYLPKCMSLHVLSRELPAITGRLAAVPPEVGEEEQRLIICLIAFPQGIS